jgi:hypothetical protein
VLKTRDADHDYVHISSISSFADSLGQKVDLGVMGVEMRMQDVRYLAFPESVGNNHFARFYVRIRPGKHRLLMNTGPHSRKTPGGMSFEYSEPDNLMLKAM